MDTTSVQNTLKNIVGSVGDYVAEILANATGNGDADALPNLNQNTMLTHATAQFFENDSLLLDENKDHDSFITAYNGFTKNIVRYLPRFEKMSLTLVSAGEKTGRCFYEEHLLHASRR